LPIGRGAVHLTQDFLFLPQGPLNLLPFGNVLQRTREEVGTFLCTLPLASNPHPPPLIILSNERQL
jgi:hypothetical protein